MQIEAIETTHAPKEVRTGAIIALAYSPELINGVGKELHDTANITTWGIPGDRHYGETRYSQSQRRRTPNNRPITAVGVEGLRAAAEHLEIDPIPAGGMGENLLIEGLGDLSEMEAGDELRVLGQDGLPSVVLKIEGQNPPCVNLKVYHRLMVKELMGKRGVLCTVLQEGNVSVGDTVQWVRGAK